MAFHTRRRSLTIAATVAASTVALLGLAGCSSGGSSDSKTLTVQVQTGQETEIGAFIKGFKAANPGVTVKTLSLGQTAKNGSNIQVITSSNAPDVALVPTNSQAFTDLTAGKQLASLSDVWKNQDLNKRYGSTLAGALSTDGTPYVVSYDETIYDVVYYNTALFQQAGIQAPTDHRIPSLDALTSMANKLKAIGKQGLSIGPGDNFQSSWMIDAFLPTSTTDSQLHSYLTSWQSSKGSAASYTDKAFTDAIAQIQAMGKAGVFQDGYLGQNVTQSEANFVQQDAGMLLDGSYSPAVLAKDGAKFDYDWMLLPPVDPSKKVEASLYNGNAYAIPAKAKNIPLAKKFLEYVMSVKGQSLLPSIGSLPSVNDIPKSAYSSLPKQTQEELADEATNGGQPGWTSIVPGGLGQQLVDPKIQEMLNGNGTPQQIGQAVQAELQKLRSSAK